jgi:hypothetical protein
MYGEKRSLAFFKIIQNMKYPLADFLLVHNL